MGAPHGNRNAAGPHSVSKGAKKYLTRQRVKKYGNSLSGARFAMAAHKKRYSRWPGRVSRKSL